MRAYNATVGATDGNIIAAIITTQVARNQPSVPSPVHGPSSMPRIRSIVHHQPRPAITKRLAPRPIRARAAVRAGASPAVAVPRSCAYGAEDITRSGGPRELCRREPCLAFVLDPEAVDPRALGLGHREVGGHGVEHAREPDRLPGPHPAGPDVLGPD